jgi:hypothetical protein
MKLSITLLAVVLTGCSSQSRFEPVPNTGGQVAFDKKTGQRCNANPKPVPLDPSDPWYQTFRDAQKLSAPPLPYCVDLK